MVQAGIKGRHIPDAGAMDDHGLIRDQDAFMPRSIALFLAVAVLTGVLDARGNGEWPSKPVNLIVPGSPGGVVDIRARWLASHLSADIGQPVIVLNRPGAGG